MNTTQADQIRAAGFVGLDHFTWKNHRLTIWNAATCIIGFGVGQTFSDALAQARKDKLEPRFASILNGFVRQ